MIRRSLSGALAALALMVLVAAPHPVYAEGKKLVIGTPGIPPIFANLVLYVAQQEGFFKKYGADVQLRDFDTGTAASRAVLSGDIDVAVGPTPLVINQVSNADANIIGFFGFSNPDWLVASTDPAKTKCTDLVGQPVGVDAIGGARAIALRTMLAGGCKEVKLDQVQQVPLSSNTAPALVAGQLTFGVLHLDDLAVLEAQGKKAYPILEMKKTNPTSHYLLVVARRDNLAANRDSFVRFTAALIAAGRFMQDPKNADQVADAATPIGHSKEITKLALKEFLAIGFWATQDDGMDEKKIAAVTAVMAKTGGITAGKEPAKYERLVDKSVWKDANAMVK
ncbi:MAG: ABC transporter substrate-binding protein [Rhodomicrobiaceae bacterium]